MCQQVDLSSVGMIGDVVSRYRFLVVVRTWRSVLKFLLVKVQRITGEVMLLIAIFVAVSCVVIDF